MKEIKGLSVDQIVIDEGYISTNKSDHVQKPIQHHPIHKLLHELQFILAETLEEKELKKWSSVMVQVMGYIDYIEQEYHGIQDRDDKIFRSLKRTLDTAKNHSRNPQNQLDMFEWNKVEKVLQQLITNNYDLDDA